jgi:hypothetical protein
MGLWVNTWCFVNKTRVGYVEEPTRVFLLVLLGIAQFLEVPRVVRFGRQQSGGKKSSLAEINLRGT